MGTYIHVTHQTTWTGFLGACKDFLSSKFFGIGAKYLYQAESINLIIKILCRQKKKKILSQKHQYRKDGTDRDTTLVKLFWADSRRYTRGILPSSINTQHSILKRKSREH